MALGKQSRKQRWKDAVYNAIYRKRYLSTFGLNPGTLREYLEVHNNYRPEALIAYTNSLHDFARMLSDAGLKPVPPKTIVVGAEKLDMSQRELIQRVFQAPVFETYGSREFMLMGAECERHSGLHLTQEYQLLEVVGPDGSPLPPGEEGDVVVTDLYNYGMPFVRYRNGDRAVAGSGGCPCGRGLPLLKQVTGRSADFVSSPEGRRITGLFFPHLLKDFRSVRRFQVVQDAPDHVEIKVVRTSEWKEEHGVRILSTIADHLGSSVRVELRPVEEIPLTSSGKFRVVINQCHGKEPAGGVR